MEWSLPSDECFEYNTGTILKIIDTHDDKSLINEYISDDCISKSNGNSFSLTIQSNRTISSIPSDEKCQIVIQRQFEECKVYSVQIIPEYDLLQGRIQSIEVSNVLTNNKWAEASTSYYDQVNIYQIRI